MKVLSRLSLPLLTLICFPALADNWPQGPGPNGDFKVRNCSASDSWSVSLGQNIAWKAELPETGQSSPVIWNDRIFLTTMKTVDSDAEIGKDIVAWCLSARDGSIIWQREITGGYQTKLSAPFGDASSPSAITDGNHVWFLNPTWQLACFDLNGNQA